MSRDIKCTGMDADQKAIVIAVPNGSRQLAMEKIVETNPDLSNAPAEEMIA